MRLDIRHLFFIFGGMFMLSFFAFLTPRLNPLFFVFCLLFFALLSLRKLEYGIYILLGDLFVTSFGYLFQWQGISLRIGMAVVFLAIVLAKTVSSFRHHESGGIEVGKFRNFIIRYKTLSVIYALLLSWIAISFTHGWLRNGFSSSFVDADRYFYLLFLAVIPALKVEKEKVFTILKAGLLWMFVFVSFIEIVFAWFGENSLLYRFVRDFRFGEITPFVGDFWRIFLQSEVYAVVGLLFAIVSIFTLSKKNLEDQGSFGKSQITNHKSQIKSNDQNPTLRQAQDDNIVMVSLSNHVWNLARLAEANAKRVLGIWNFFRSNYSLLFISTVILLLSLSRSFWLGTGIAMLFAVLVIARTTRIKQMFICGVRVFVIFVFSVIFVLLVSRTWFGAQNVAKERLNAAEPAASSRSAQVGFLIEGIKGSPVIGYGFGKHLESRSLDPRVVQSTAGGTGKVSTYAFELGWLDIALKTGLIGAILYLSFIVLLMRSLLLQVQSEDVRMNATDPYTLTSFLSLLALLVIHVFTPYLNHPLGIGFLMIALIVLTDENGKIEPKVHLSNTLYPIP